MKKNLCLLLALFMLLAIVFVGCDKDTDMSEEPTKAPETEVKTTGATEATEEPEADDGLNPLINMDSLTPITNELVELTMIYKWGGDQSTPEEMYIFEFLEKVCNLKFDVTAIDSAAFNERIVIILNTGELPDLIGSRFSTAEMVQYFSDAGLAMDMLPLVEKYAPDIMAAFESNPDALTMSLIDGKLLSLPETRMEGPGSGRNWINQKWLSTLGLDMPETLAGLKDVFVAFRDGDPNENGEADEIAFGGSWDEGYSDIDPIFNAFGWLQAYGSNDKYMQLDYSSGEGMMKFVPLDPAFEDYLTYMNDLWMEGLIDPDIFTQGETASLAKVATGQVGYAAGGAQYVLLPEEQGSATVDDYTYKYLYPMTVEEGAQKYIPLNQPIIPGNYIISAESEYGDVLVRLANLTCNWETNTLFYWGPGYGTKYDINEDHKGAIALKDDDNPMAGYYYPHLEENYPDMTAWQYINNYIGGIQFKIFGASGNKPFIPESMWDQVPSEYNPIYQIYFENSTMPEDYTKENWTYDMYQASMTYGVPGIPIMYFSAEDNARIAELRTAINGEVETMEAKIITGAEPLSAYATMVQNLKDLGAEEYEEIFQKYYNAFYENNSN